MSSNEETLSEKPKGVDADSFPGPIKPTSTSYVSSGLSNDDPHSKKAKSEASVSSGLTKPSGKTGVTSGLSIGVPNSKNPDCTKTGVSLGVRGKAAVSSGAKGKAFVSAKAVEVMSFKDVKFGPHGGELRFRLIHFWEARNVVTKMLIGLEMLLIDQEETLIQGFIPAGRIDTYLPHMKVGGIYRLNSFYGSNNKTLYRVAEPSVTITFSSSSVLSDLEDSSVCFPEDRFRFHGYEEFDAVCDLRGDLYDYVGHIKLVNGQVLNDSLVLDDAEIASSRRVLLHVQTHDDTFGWLWFPLEPNKPVLKTSAPSIDITGVPNKPPANVMAKALSQDIITLSAKTLPLAASPIYLALYFSEPQSLGRTMKRSFNVFLDNEQLNSVPIVPVFGKATEFVTRDIVDTWQSKVIFRSTSDSTLPPIVNAMELYSISKGVGGDYGGGGQSGDDTDDRNKDTINNFDGD
ncbi:hypothetical protein F2Q68_00040382 [Brassica cretica]|uniref:Malectin-like domain-containing protein n=1 Tax=Brassica cretica TaxID=69181 RepID=A0A8S9MER2_BRACR|nr:hypothetical protein F2Q68_00040382 [Brassica cretica]